MFSKLNLRSLASSISVAALTLGVTVAAMPAQKASAQLVGSGASSIIDLADLLRTNGNRYVVTGSGAGRTAFANGDINFVAADADPGSYDFPVVVVNEAFLQVAFPYNVPGFDGQLTRAQACGLINGDITNWNQITRDVTDENGDPVLDENGDPVVEVLGPDLPVFRVARGDSSGTTATLNNSFAGPICGISIPNPPSPDGSDLPQPNGNEIVVPPADDPFNSGDDNNSGNYSLGIVSTIQSTEGAVGYAEDVLALNRGLSLTGDIDNDGATTIAAGPTYVVFRAQYDTQEQADDAVAKCLNISDSENIAARGYTPGDDAVPGGNVDLCNSISGPGDGGQ